MKHKIVVSMLTAIVVFAASTTADAGIFGRLSVVWNGCNPCEPAACQPCERVACQPCEPIACQPCQPIACQPCEAACDPCASCCDLGCRPFRPFGGFFANMKARLAAAHCGDCNPCDQAACAPCEPIACQPCEVVACDPCEAACCDPCGLKPFRPFGGLLAHLKAKMAVQCCDAGCDPCAPVCDPCASCKF